MSSYFRLFLIIGVLGFSASNVKSQESNQIIVGAPFLTIAPDSRAAGYGDQGAATNADNNSQFWNPAKYPFTQYKGGATYTYTPWLKNIADGINLHSIAGFYKFNDKQAISASVRYFTIGEIPINDEMGNNFGNAVMKPNDFAVDLGYSRKLSDNFSAAIVFRFLRSDLTGGSSVPSIGGVAIDSKAASSVAADIAVYYNKIYTSKNVLAFGLTISNLGPKISYSDNGDKIFIPTNLRIGGRYTFNIGEKNQLSALLETTKLLVPTPDYKDGINVNADKTVLEGIFSSFGDAPGGFSEEMKEFTYSVGLEYALYNTFMARTGYFHESKMKGNRQFVTFGIGAKYRVFEIDAAYLVPTSSGNTSPLDNTFRFSVGVQLGK